MHSCRQFQCQQGQVWISVRNDMQEHGHFIHNSYKHFVYTLKQQTLKLFRTLPLPFPPAFAPWNSYIHHMNLAWDLCKYILLRMTITHDSESRLHSRFRGKPQFVQILANEKGVEIKETTGVANKPVVSFAVEIPYLGFLLEAFWETAPIVLKLACSDSRLFESPDATQPCWMIGTDRQKRGKYYRSVVGIRGWKNSDRNKL